MSIDFVDKIRGAGVRADLSIEAVHIKFSKFFLSISRQKMLDWDENRKNLHPECKIPKKFSLGNNDNRVLITVLNNIRLILKSVINIILIYIPSV